jgi:diguanylate cyclase (GGDEF)-like protein
MKYAVPKSRTAPLILFAIISILVSLIFGLYYMNQINNYSYNTNLARYDTQADDFASILKQEVENTYNTIQVSANLIANSGVLTKSNILKTLEVVGKQQKYEDVAIVDINGTGYNSTGQYIDISKTDYFDKIKNGIIISSNDINTNEKNLHMKYIAPIIDNNIYTGALIATISGEFNDLIFDNQELMENDIVYLINENKQLISYIEGKQVTEFDFDAITSKGKYYDEIKNETINYSEVNSFKKLFLKDSKFQSDYIWYSKPIGINNWSLLIGREYIISAQTRNVLMLASTVWAFFTASFIALFIFLIISLRRANRKVIKMLYLDPVTGGDNWYKFRINASRIINSKLFVKRNYAIINFDINRFKIINDAYGYQKGDEVLKEIYQIIKKWTRSGELLTRYAADQFYIMISFINEHEVSYRINDLNDRLHQLRYTKTAKIYYGVYFITEQNDSIDRMGEFAGIAKNNIKGNGEGIISFFDDIARGRVLKEEEIEKSMNDALKNEEFHVYLQPKYTVKDETISGAEALVRWFNNEGHLITPGYFIPVFEKNGFITELDFYMLRKVCEIIRGWLDKGYTPLPISVNISRLHFVNPHLAEIICEIVDNYEIPHNLIELELTESAFLQNKQSLIKTVILLREFGFMVSMDDFGAGYSSLNSLKDLPLDVVKLDGELFRLSDQVERGLTVIRNTITMAKDLHMKVVAECIETKEQVEFLYSVGCDIIQGYYYAKPMPTEQFEDRYLTLVEID